MKKVLIVIQLLRRGGVELTAINIARHLDKTKFEVSFLLISSELNQDISLLNELEKEGYKFHYIPEKVDSYIKKYNYLNCFFKENYFDVVHSHVIFFSGIVLKAANNNGIPLRIAHSHITKWNNDETLAYKAYKSAMKAMLKKYANVKLACSKEAGEFLFGKREYNKNGLFFPNSIDCNRFSFDIIKRSQIRSEFGIDKQTVLVGHIGTIYKIKNQLFLVEVIAEMLKTNHNVKCIMVGEEIEKNEVKQKAKALGVEDKIIFTGQRPDVDCFYSAFDIMIFPSLHEGLPVSLIEAQASKLPCLVSDTVDLSSKFNENFEFLPLNSPVSNWAKKAFDLIMLNRDDIDNSELISNYDINTSVKKLEKIILEYLKG